MNKISKGVTTGAMLFALLLTAGCSNDDSQVVSAEGTSTTAPATASPTATASPSATPSADTRRGAEIPASERETDNIRGLPALTDEEVAEYMEANSSRPLGIDVDVLLSGKNTANDVLTTFPEEAFNTKEGIRSVLATYQHINSVEAFQGARDTSKDFEYIAPFGESIDAEFMTFIKNSIDERGRFTNILTVPSDGVVEIQGKTYTVVDGSLEASYNYPSVQVGAAGDVLYIEGTRTHSFDLQGGEVFEGSYTYYIEAKPVDGKWIIAKFSTVDDGKATSGLKGE